MKEEGETVTRGQSPDSMPFQQPSVDQASDLECFSSVGWRRLALSRGGGCGSSPVTDEEGPLLEWIIRELFPKSERERGA